MHRLIFYAFLAFLVGCSGQQNKQNTDFNAPLKPEAQWHAGDHHVHSRFSVGWDREKEPPEPIIGGDAIYPIPMNALMSRHHGLSWMVTTDHGGPGHSKVTQDWAYPALLRSRKVLPEVLQYHGLELNSPGADHATLIVPKGPNEATQLFRYESAYDRNEIWPQDGSRDDPSLMLAALEEMGAAELPPIVIANHPSRSGTSSKRYGRYEPAELRAWNDAAPNVAVGFAGAPGHQAVTLAPNGDVIPDRPRGAVVGPPTMGGFDPMTSRLGGLWDALLAEGRRWWITANSDSHIHYTEGGSDFWPGEYSKTWVYAAFDYNELLDAVRSGRIFVATGDLVTGLALTLTVDGAAREIWPGDTVKLREGTEFSLSITLTDPEIPNAAGHQPSLSRLDVIIGDISGPAQNQDNDHNPTTRVASRIHRAEMMEGGERLTARWESAARSDQYIRLRGTNTTELEPLQDPMGENPWDDLWFYSNPIFIEVEKSAATEEQ